MRKRVLVILDSVDLTRGVRKLAIKYVRIWPAQLTGVSVIDVATAAAAEVMSIGAIYLKTKIDRQRANSVYKLTKKKLKLFFQECFKEGLFCQTVVVEGNHIAEIESQAQENDAIVMRAFRHKGVKEFFFGSCTEHLPRKSKTPLFISR